MIKVPMVIAVMCCIPYVAPAAAAAVRSDVHEQQVASNDRPDQDDDDRDRAVDLPDCSEAGVLPCFELVWVDGVQRKMVFMSRTAMSRRDCRSPQRIIARIEIYTKPERVLGGRGPGVEVSWRAGSLARFAGCHPDEDRTPPR